MDNVNVFAVSKVDVVIDVSPVEVALNVSPTLANPRVVSRLDSLQSPQIFEIRSREALELVSADIQVAQRVTNVRQGLALDVLDFVVLQVQNLKIEQISEPVVPHHVQTVVDQREGLQLVQPNESVTFDCRQVAINYFQFRQ